MKMKTKKILVAALGAVTLCTLASCGNSSKSVDEVLSGFQTELENQSIKGTFKNNYQVSVDAHGGTANFSSFRHNIDSTLDFEFTLGENFYFYSKKTWEDKLEENSKKVTEALLYKENDKYMYSTTYTAPVEVSGDIKSQIDEILKDVSNEQAGGISLASLIYTKKQYEFDTFGLTSTFEVDDIRDSKYTVTDENGLDIVYSPEYIGYMTDQGYSDFGAQSGKDSAAEINISVNEKGYVTSWKENYQAALDFAIMTPKPTVSIDGSRELSVNYGATITEKTDSDIVHEALAAKVTTSDASNGSYTVSWFDYDNNDFTMNPINSNDNVRVGYYLAISPKANEGYEVDKVTVNGKETNVVVNGLYCFKVTNEDQKVSVSFKEKGAETPVAPELLGSYQGSASNGTIMDINVYKDGTFSVTCPGFGGAKAGDGTYTKDGSVLTLTSNNMQYFTVVNTTIEVTMSSDFQTLTTSSFFNGEAITFTLKK